MMNQFNAPAMPPGDNPAARLKGEIQNTEFRKQSLVAPLENEISQARQKIDMIFMEIGQIMYDTHLEGGSAPETLIANFDEISAHKDFIAEKNGKIQEFTERYDEEIRMLAANLENVLADAKKLFCTGCGEQYNPLEDVFCKGCGMRLIQ
jgi:predicted  nucleic acid-binding Zn-ribbon protein